MKPLFYILISIEFLITANSCINPGEYNFPDEEAEFPGGKNALNSFISDNISFPEIAIEEGIEGRCIIGFKVGRNGKIKDATVLQSVAGCSECDKEALRVVKMMPRWKAAQKNGKAVQSSYQLPVRYQLD